LTDGDNLIFGLLMPAKAWIEASVTHMASNGALQFIQSKATNTLRGHTRIAL
jgi:hypothetical protein